MLIFLFLGHPKLNPHPRSSFTAPTLTPIPALALAPACFAAPALRLAFALAPAPAPLRLRKLSQLNLLRLLGLMLCALNIRLLKSKVKQGYRVAVAVVGIAVVYP